MRTKYRVMERVFDKLDKEDSVAYITENGELVLFSRDGNETVSEFQNLQLQEKVFIVELLLSIYKDKMNTFLQTMVERAQKLATMVSPGQMPHGPGNGPIIPFPPRG